MDISEALNVLADGKDLSEDDAYVIFHQIMHGEVSPVQIAAILMALRTKVETGAEIAGAASAMREVSSRVEVGRQYLVDTAGTGGSGDHKLFNISTAAAIVASAGGANVAKHGNRGVSSKSGSADVLEVAGANCDLLPKQVARCINEVGFGFIFAQKFHSAMRFAGPVRQELKVRTIFNLLGPLTNPASAERQVIGVFSPDFQQKVADAAQELGALHVMVVHAAGLDEISCSGPTEVVELNHGNMTQYTIHPSDFGLPDHNLENLKASTPEESLALIKQSLTPNANRAAQDIVALNAAAALYVAGIVASLANGVKRAQSLIEDGSAINKLNEYVEFTKSL